MNAFAKRVVTHEDLDMCGALEVSIFELCPPQKSLSRHCSKCFAGRNASNGDVSLSCYNFYMKFSFLAPVA
jgi:hypothetical protein